MALLRVFFRLVRPTTRNISQFGSKVLSRSCYCWRRAPSCKYRSADMSIEARVMRLSRRQGPSCVFVAPLAPYDVSFASCGPLEPQATGHHVPHDGGRAANTRHLPGCGRQIRRPASSKRIYFTTSCSGGRRAPELDSSIVVI